MYAILFYVMLATVVVLVFIIFQLNSRCESLSNELNSLVHANYRLSFKAEQYATLLKKLNNK